MASDRRPRSRWTAEYGGVVLLVALVGCALITLSAMLRAPDALRLPAQADARGWSVELPADQTPTTWWRAELAIAPERELAWRFRASGGLRRALELRWEPETLRLRLLLHDPPRSGTGALQATRLELARHAHDRLPTAVQVARRGQRILVLLDGVTVIDRAIPLALGTDRSWQLTDSGEVQDLALTVHLDPHRSPPPASEGLDRGRALELTRRALLSRGDPAAVARAHQAVRILGEDARDLAAWLAWDRARHALASGAESDAAIEALIANPHPLRHGLLGHLLPGLADRALARPSVPQPAAEAIARRSAALRSLARAARAIATGDDEYPAALLAHLAGILTGAEGEPTPAAAPPWISTRWRLAAGRIPDGVPPLPPFETSGHQGLDLALAGLAARSGLEEPAAVVARNYAHLAGAGALDAAQRALDTAPEGDRPLILGLLAAAGVVPPGEALAALDPAGAEGRAPADRHPLAYALQALLRHRHPHLAAASPRSLPEPLADYRRLLSGAPGATLLVFALADDTLPPPDALAAALAMQEVAGQAPDWPLLERLPALDLPLALLVAGDGSE